MKELEKIILQHLKERGWDNLRPADVAKSIMIEGAELLELFQWENLPLAEIKNDPEKMKQIAKELADVLTYAIEMSVLLQLDTEKIIRDKVAHSAKKYPAELMRKSTGEPGSAADAEYWRIKREHRKQENS
jgi:NTP pyrophosphatase (non-canonical NTP hydrolase)